MKTERICFAKDGKAGCGPVIYWMLRDMRIRDNWALSYASDQARIHKRPLIVCICLGNSYTHATGRRCAFLLEGLQELSESFKKKNIHFAISTKKAEDEIPALIRKINARILVCDFSPLENAKKALNKTMKKIKIPIRQIDAHNIVPCTYASDKQEYGAYTLRPKIQRLLPEFLEDFPKVKKHPFTLAGFKPAFNKEKILKALAPDSSVAKTPFFKGGEKEANKAFDSFLKHRLNFFSDKRNDPNAEAQSDLSPYLNFGFISAQKIALTIERLPIGSEFKNAFLEELIIRKELSDNFCFYNKNYDNINCAPAWATLTIEEHQNDPRPYIYTRTQLESATTHDDLWNAAQKQMLTTGKMHGYLRMYWAKKILEWTKNPAFAFKTAVYLNDKYSLDGCDPNGYAGIAWSICGVHDRAWFSRDVFGKIRYMSYNGCKNKFNIKAYIAKINNL